MDATAQGHDERLRLLQIVLDGADSAESWDAARIAVLAAQCLPQDQISEITGADADTVQTVIDGVLSD